MIMYLNYTFFMYASQYRVEHIHMNDIIYATKINAMKIIIITHFYQILGP